MPLVHILTPFSRSEYYAALDENFRQADSWTLIVTRDQRERFQGKVPERRMCVVPDIAAGLDPCYAKVNLWIASQGAEIRDEDYYLFLCDDDAIPADLVERLKGFTEDILVLSCKRGDQVPPAPPLHPNWPLVASPHNMVTCYCTWEQAVVKGSILRQIRFEDRSSTADGAMMEWLKATFGDRIRYVPELFLKFNYLQPGRWLIREDPL